MTRTRRAELANTVVLYRFAPPRDLKPRRRAIRHQAEPQERLYDSFVDWPIRVGEPPRPLWRNYDHVLAVIVLIAIFLVAIYATGNKIQGFHP